MFILKIYSIILLTISMILNIVYMLKDNEINNRISRFISTSLFVPTLIYIILGG